jgi:hypothetical protein
VDRAGAATVAPRAVSAVCQMSAEDREHDIIMRPNHAYCPRTEMSIY